MAEAVTLYEFEISPFCEKVRRGLQVKNISFTRVECGGLPNWELKKINPRRKMPALVWGDKKLLDSTDILRFLDKKVPEPALYPSGGKDAAMVHLLEDWADESLIWHEVYMRFYVEPAAGRMAARIGKHLPSWMQPLSRQIVLPMIRRMGNVQGVGRKPRDVVEAELRQHYQMLSTLLGKRKYLVGSSLTAADLAVSAMIWGLIDAGHRPVVAQYPGLLEWYERVTRDCVPYV